MRLLKALAAGVAAALAMSALPPAGLAAARAAPPAAGRLAQLPLVEAPAAGSGDTLVVLYSGDGGWANIDANLAAGFAKAGAPVVGVNSLTYFRTGRTPEAAAADLSAVMDHYMRAWGRSKVILAGYSFGAGALPAIVAHLPPEMLAHVRLLALVGVGRVGELKFQPRDWLDIPAADAYPIAPVLGALGALPRVCVFGATDRHDACAAFGRGLIQPIEVAGGHHFSGDYASVSAAILRAAGL